MRNTFLKIRKICLTIICLGCTLLLFASCSMKAVVVKGEKKVVNMESLVSKAMEKGTSTPPDERKTVGVAIKVEEFIVRTSQVNVWSIKEEEAYQKVISKVLSTLEKNGIGAILLYDENDPRIDHVGTIMYVKYSEAGETRHTPVNRAPSMVGYEGSRYIANMHNQYSGARNVGDAFGLLHASMFNPSIETEFILDEFYNISINNVVTGKTAFCSSIEEAINSLNSIQVNNQFAIPMNGQYVTGSTPTTKTIVDQSIAPVAPGSPASEPSYYEPVVDMEFVFVKGGEYEMGCGVWVGDCEDDEEPAHRVRLDDFYMGKYEVTVEQWKKFIQDTGYKGDGFNYPDFTQDNNHPVVCVSWYEAKAFVDWLSGKTGEKYRLPTEAEWEYAARSRGQKVRYGTKTGDVSHDLVNYEGTGGKDQWQYTSPVGSFPANPLGLYDMVGNVWEWCSDWYDEDYYNHSPVDNPNGPRSGYCRALRGGSWDDNVEKFCCIERCYNCPTCWFMSYGFRVALTH